MAKTHQLVVRDADGERERKVDHAARLLLKAGPDLLSWKVSELESVVFEPGYEGGGAVCFVPKVGGGYWRRVAGTARLELGDERWQISDLAAFVLTRTPKPVEAPAPPSRVFRIRYLDGREEVLEVAGGQVKGRIYDLTPADGLGFQDGRAWGAMLDDIDTIERVGPEDLETAEELEEVSA